MGSRSLRSFVPRRDLFTGHLFTLTVGVVVVVGAPAVDGDVGAHVVAHAVAHAVVGGRLVVGGRHATRGLVVAVGLGGAGALGVRGHWNDEGGE